MTTSNLLIFGVGLISLGLTRPLAAQAIEPLAEPPDVILAGPATVEIEERAEGGPRPRKRLEIEEIERGDGERRELRRVPGPPPEIRPRVERRFEHRFHPETRGAEPRAERDVIIRRLPPERRMHFEVRPPHAPLPPGERPFRGQQEIRRGGPESKLEHVREAIRHLRQAEMPEVAERLEQEAQKLARERESGDDRLEQSMRRLQAERAELEREVQRLREQLERLRREEDAREN